MTCSDFLESGCDGLGYFLCELNIQFLARYLARPQLVQLPTASTLFATYDHWTHMTALNRS